MDELATWRNISILFLGLQCFVGVVLALGLTYVLVRLMNTAQAKTEIGARKLQQLTRRVAVETDRYATKVTEPVLKAQRQATRAQTFVRSLVPGARRRAAPPAPVSPPPGVIQQ